MSTHYPRDPDAALQQALGFTDDDLHANRAGHLSTRQARLIAFQRGQWRYLMVATLFFDLMVLGLAMLYRWPLIVLALLVVGSLLVYGFALHAHTHARLDLTTGQVARLTGVAMLKPPFSTQSRDGYLLTVAGETFVITRAVFLALRAGDAYCLYYLPYLHLLLSIEVAGSA